jgi:hypothetical protein
MSTTSNTFLEGQTGHLDEIYTLMGVLPEGTWRYELDSEGEEDPSSDRYVMLKTVTLRMEITVS